MASKNQTPPCNNRANNNSKNRRSKRYRDHLDVYICYVIVVIATCHVTGVGAGSRMIEPPTRASLWRYGFGTPINFDDDEVMCGGYNRQYGSNAGRCGVCGDPWDEPPPRRHEAGGLTSPSPRPVRVYQVNGEMPVFIDSTADLVGQYEFRLCELTNSNETPDQDCFDQTPLSIRESRLGQSYRIGQSGGLVALHLVLPENLTCTHCILQWRHVTGNRLNKASCVKCAENPEPLCNFCLGCGQQAWYQGCADIAIHDVMGSHPAVRGVRTQQELKDQWASTLQDLKQNCSCAGGGGNAYTSVPASENAINSSQPYTVSATSSISPGNVTATQPFQTTSSGAVVNPVTPTPKPVTSTTTTTTTTTSTTTTTTTTPHPITPKPYIPSTQQPTTKATNPDTSVHPGKPILKINWQDLFLPPTICYLPFRPPWYLKNAGQWCIRNCPRSRCYCNYKICRPVRCPRPTPRPNRVRKNGLQYLLPFLFLSEAIADLI